MSCWRDSSEIKKQKSLLYLNIKIFKTPSPHAAYTVPGPKLSVWYLRKDMDPLDKNSMRYGVLGYLFITVKLQCLRTVDSQYLVISGKEKIDDCSFPQAEHTALRNHRRKRANQ